MKTVLPAFHFSSGQSLFSSGTLEIDGGTFEAYSTSWSFIYLLNSGADGSYIKKATINDANYGIYTNGVLPSMRSLAQPKNANLNSLSIRMHTLRFPKPIRSMP